MCVFIASAKHPIPLYEKNVTNITLQVVAFLRVLFLQLKTFSRHNQIRLFNRRKANIHWTQVFSSKIETRRQKKHRDNEQ